jgi:hypothetical protein
MHRGLHVKYPLFLSDFNKTWNFSIDFQKYSNIKFDENVSSGSWVVPRGQTYRQTYRQNDKANSHFPRFCKSTKKPLAYASPEYQTHHWLCHLEYSVNQGHWIQSDNMVASIKLPQYTNRIIHKAININLYIIIKRKKATDKAGLDHQPHNSATERVHNNPQHGQEQLQRLPDLTLPLPPLLVPYPLVIHHSPLSLPTPVLTTVYCTGVSISHPTLLKQQFTNFTVGHSSQNSATMGTWIGDHLGSPHALLLVHVVALERDSFFEFTDSPSMGSV